MLVSAACCLISPLAFAAPTAVLVGFGIVWGATIVADHAGEMISEYTVAMKGGLGLGTIAGTIHPYPTQAEVSKKIIDTYKSAGLTPPYFKELSKVIMC